MPSLLVSVLLLFFATSNPFAEPALVRVLVFARTDCPITDRYAPELSRIAHEFGSKDVRFWIVYPDRSETAGKIARHMAEYALPGTGISDPEGQWQKRAEATVSPQAAVFDRQGQLRYTGRIDDRYIAFGKARSAPEVHDLEDAIRATLEGRPVLHSHTKAVGCYLGDLGNEK